ncbi:hypothetical protein GGI04_002009 [Coemansia thaxteri]|nr:hypothetical protein GGI04_002009 [Coemansia thaxteri]
MSSNDGATTSATRSELQSRIQYLQTVAVEASNQLRNQCTKVMQNQAIRLEDVADTEIEDIVGLDNCMDELMLCVMYTELRKDVREITDSLMDQQYNLLSARKRVVGAMPFKMSPEGDEAAGASLSSANQAQESDDDTPHQLSGTDTFRTAQGVPMFSSGGALSPRPAGESDSNFGKQLAARATPTIPDLAFEISELEQRLYGVCIEIDEWRRTRCILGFIEDVVARGSNAASPGRRRSSRPASIRSMGLAARLPVEQIISEARERQRKRASSMGNAGASPLSPRDAALASSLMLSASPPLSRLLQAEREAERSRSDVRGGGWREFGPAHGDSTTSPLCQPTFDAVQGPSGQPYQAQLGSLRLIETSSNGAADSSGGSGAGRPRTLVDDVRIIGWVTRGSGLDVHTEFKVVVHLTRGDNLTVMRRYTDFALLREVLCQRYYTFSKRIPHLPAKKAFGKFEDQFLRKREKGLQFFLAYVMLHPVIGCSPIVRKWLEGVPT